MRTSAVGVRELKSRLARYLRRVRAGERLVVTDRGQPTAEIIPVGERHRSAEATLAQLEADGVVTRPRTSQLTAFSPVKPRGRPLSEAIIRERESGW